MKPRWPMIQQIRAKAKLKFLSFHKGLLDFIAWREIVWGIGRDGKACHLAFSHGRGNGKSLRPMEHLNRRVQSLHSRLQQQRFLLTLKK